MLAYRLRLRAKINTPKTIALTIPQMTAKPKRIGDRVGIGAGAGELVWDCRIEDWMSELVVSGVVSIVASTEIGFVG